MIELFVRLTQVLALPKSLGEIYGLLFITAEPIPFALVIKRLKISSGSASTGLRILRGMGAVRTVYVAGDRRDHFAAETELRKLTAGFLRRQLGESLAHGQDLLDSLENTSATPEARGRFLDNRLDLLRRWHSQAKAALPALLGVFETPRGDVT